MPKSLPEQLADVMSELVPVVNAKGKQEMVPAYEAVARQLVRSIPEMKPRDQLLALRSLEKLGVNDELRKRAENSSYRLTREQMRDRIQARFDELLACGAIRVKTEE